jgi:hypothetical protein
VPDPVISRLGIGIYILLLKEKIQISGENPVISYCLSVYMGYG